MDCDSQTKYVHGYSFTKQDHKILFAPTYKITRVFCIEHNTTIADLALSIVRNILKRVELSARVLLVVFLFTTHCSSALE